nr:hypothetical protein [Tanacetum cinerariifolium]
MDEQMVDPEVNEEVMDDDNLDVEDEVAAVREQVQVVEAQMAQVVNRLEEIETRVQQVQTLQTALHETESQNQQLRTRVAELESHMGIVMLYMLWMRSALPLWRRGPQDRLRDQSSISFLFTLLI